MATVAIMVGGAVLNAATFIGGNYLEEVSVRRQRPGSTG